MDGDARTCSACGATVSARSPVCPVCGHTFTDETLRVAAVTPVRPPHQQTAVRTPRRSPGATTTPLFAAFVLVLASLVVAAALGQWLISLLLVPVVLTLGVAVAALRWGEIEEPVDDFVQHAADNLWSAARVAHVSLSNWSRAGRVEAGLRAKRRRLRARHGRLLRALGEAVLAGDPAQVERAREQALSNAAEIEACSASLRAVRSQAAARVQEEREATASTEVFPTPGGSMAGRDPVRQSH